MKDSHYEGRINVPGMLDQIRPEAEKAIPDYIELLKDRDASMRSNVASSLGAHGPRAKAAIPALLLALNDAHASVRGNAAWALGRITSEKEMIAEIAPRLRALLKDKDALPRVQAAWSLWKLTGNTKETVPILTETFEKKETLIIMTAVYALAGMGPKAKDAIPALRKLLAGANPQSPYYDSVVETLRKIDPKAVPADKRRH
jgi:HEAT repeat protein